MPVITTLQTSRSMRLKLHRRAYDGWYDSLGYSAEELILKGIAS